MTKRKWLPIFFILSSFFLFACGLTSLFNGNTNAPASNTPEPPTSVTGEPANNTPEGPAETAEETTPEETQTEDPAAAPEMDAESACYHPYFPVVDGASWTYQTQSGTSYTLAMAAVQDENFRMTQTMHDSDTTLTIDWYCTDDGLLRGTFAQVDLLDESAGTDDAPEIAFETLEWEGETLPPVENWEVGHTWTSTYKLNGEYDMNGINATAEVTVSIDHTLAAVDSVTVPAGTFDEAYRVDSSGEIDMVLLMGETSTPVSGVTFSFETWYVEDLGMIKSQDTFEGFSDATELVESSLLP